jgi:hypothetical protein
MFGIVFFDEVGVSRRELFQRIDVILRVMKESDELLTCMLPVVNYNSVFLDSVPLITGCKNTYVQGTHCFEYGLETQHNENAKGLPQSTMDAHDGWQ